MSKQYDTVNKEIHRMTQDILDHKLSETDIKNIRNGTLSRYELSINPKIRLYNNPSHLNYMYEPHYIKFKQQLKNSGLHVVTNIDEFKTARLDTFSKLSKEKPPSNKIPDLSTINIVKNTLSVRLFSRIRDYMFHKALEKQYGIKPPKKK